MTTVLQVSDLRVELAATGSPIVDQVSFDLAEGEVLGLVGESGCGKTTIGTALLNYTRKGARVAAGRVLVAGTDMLQLESKELRAARGRLISYVPQDPSAALNPALRIGAQIVEVFEVHRLKVDEARLHAALEEVGLPADRRFLRRFPHQLSGGQRQRVCLAMAFLLRPKVLVLDEPTTGLDVTTQARILRTVRELCDQYHVGAVYVSHDLAVVAGLAHKLVVMYAGRMAETGPAGEVFDRPCHPYTVRLLKAIPDVREIRMVEPLPGTAPGPGDRRTGCEFAERCPAVIEICLRESPFMTAVGAMHSARCHRAGEFDSMPPRVGIRREPDASDAVMMVEALCAWYGRSQVLYDVSLELRRGECLALVGESGSGKTTLARTIVGLHWQYEGTMRFRDELLIGDARSRSQLARRELQYIFQNPYGSLNPRKTVAEIVETPLRHFYGLRGAEARDRVATAVSKVSLSTQLLNRYPDQLSGGERQRVAIARALACEPTVLICDEVTSALDVSVQASIVDVLSQLQESEELTLLFVTHNLALVRVIADRVTVMHRGRIVETGLTDATLDAPVAKYTQELLANTPTMTSAASGRAARSAVSR
jgi:peptide/nickel transport system ATP-binding protein